AAKEAFTGCVHQWRVDCRLEYSAAGALRDAIKLNAKLVVVVTNDEGWTSAEGRSVSQLLRCPPLAWLAGDGDVDLLRVHVHDEEREDGPEPNIVHLKEIAGPYRMVVEEDTPLLPIARWAYRADVPLDRSLRSE